MAVVEAGAMIIDKNRSQRQQQHMTQQQLQQLNQQQAVQRNHESQFDRLRRRHHLIAGDSCTAATINQSANNFQEAGQVIEIEDDEGNNDEENIVIDMQDEDEDDESATNDSIGENGCNNNYHLNNDLTATADYGSGHFVSAYTTYNNNPEVDRKNIITDSTKFEHQLQFESNQIDGASCYSVFKFNIGDLVWFDPNQLGYSIPGKVIDFYPDLKVLTIEGYSQTIGDSSGDLERHNKLLLQADQELQVHNLSESQQFKTIKLRKPLINERGAEDLVDLEELSIESIIWNLKLRYKQELIYTNCGQKVLISVNPCKQLSDIYNLDQVNKYDSLDTNKLRSLVRVTNKSTACSPDPQSNLNLLRWLLLHDDAGQQKTNIKNPKEPHIFKLANEALKKLLIDVQDQCIVLLGESGSGKTEACKLLIQYLATVNKSPTNLMTEQILESIQVLESFGNAKTIHNDNSSRFGRLLNIRFNLFNGFITDAKTVDLNLLDRTRIVSQSENERNYHIFYELLSGLSKNEKEKYGLQTADKYFYLNQGHCVDLPGKEDGDNFRSLLASMQVLGFNYEEQDTIFRILASVLHLGNIYFHRKVLAVRSGKLAQQQQQQQQQQQNQPPGGNVAGVEGVEIGSDTEVRWVSHLLQIQFDSVMRCMTVRTTESATSVPGNTYTGEMPQVVVDRIITPLNIDQALDTRDAIARALYNCLFKWLVQRINLMINGNDSLLSDDDNQQLSRHQVSNNAFSSSSSNRKQHKEPIYLCRTSESLCEFQPNKLNQSDSHNSSLSRGQIKQSTCSKTNYKSLQQLQNSTNQQQQLQKLTSATISILDAFGFENLSENNFEQLCINYTAELLNYHTNRYLIRLEQAEYIKERLRWTPLSILNSSLNSYSSSLTANSGSLLSASATATSASNSSNSASSIVNLISKKPLGILALLDDECNFPKATDQSFVEKCHHNHTLNENYQGARLAANCQEFGIRHFKQSSRLVWYQVDGFVEKNRDNLRQDIVELLVGSKMIIVADMLRKIHQTNCDNYGSNNKTLSRTYDGRYVSMKPRTTTVAAKFQDTLLNNRVLESINYTASSTMNTQLPTEVSHYQTTTTTTTTTSTTTASTMKESNGEMYGGNCAAKLTSSCLDVGRPNPWFVICFKPNRSQSAQVFDVAFVQEQFKCVNLLEISQMRKIGFPIRLRYGEFVRRYKCLVPQKFLNNLTSCQDIRMANENLMNSTIEGGYRKQKKRLENMNNSNNTNNNKCEIKRAIRDVCSAIVEYRFIKQQQESLVKDQYQCGLTKMFLNEKLYYHIEEMRINEHKKAIEILQKSIRMWLVKREYIIKRRSAIIIQANVRAYLARREFWRKCLLIINLQRTWRRQLIIKRRKMLEAKRQAQRKHQQYLLQEVQAQQMKQANQFRFRLQTNKSVNSKRSSQGSHYAPKPSLDIPEDLAQLYRLQRNWLPVHNLSHINEVNLLELIDREKKRYQRHRGNPLSVPFIVFNSSFSEKNDAKMIEYIQELELDDKYSLQNFLIKYYTTEVAQFGYSRLPITRPFIWPQLARKRHVAIRTRLDSEQRIRERFGIVEQKAVAIYKLILRYIDSDLDSNHGQDKQHLQPRQQQNGDESMQKLVKFKLIADYVIYLCLNDELLRNELYLQLASQSWQNPNFKSTENVWKLMANCLGCFEPIDEELAKYLLRYANDYCCDKYRSIILERLSYLSIQQDDDRTKVRRYPLTMLEYMANEQAIGRLAIAGSCYVDDYGLNEPISGDFETNFEDLNATNYSNKTMVRIRPQTKAEQVASAILGARNVPARNLTGWSVEVQHEAAQSDFSCRLRGDDFLLDHLSRVELLPKFAELIEFGTDEFQEVPNVDNESLSIEKQTKSDNCAGYSRPINSRIRKHSLNEFTAPSSLRSPQNYPEQQQQQQQMNRQSIISQQSYESNLTSGKNRRFSSASSDIGYPLAGKLSQASKLNRRYIQDNSQDGNIPYNTAMQYDRYCYPDANMPEQTSLHRRSMSMQELQLASSALNGRYFQQHQTHNPQQQRQTPSSNHYASSYVSSQGGFGGGGEGEGEGEGRGGAGSLQQLAGGAIGKQSHQHYVSPLRGRSQTPNSMMLGNGALNRLSSSAYGSETYASSRITPNSGPTLSDVTGGGGEIVRRSRAEGSSNRMNRAARPRRSASSSSRVPVRHNLHSNAPGSDYASAHSDYERIGSHVKRYAAPNQSIQNLQAPLLSHQARQSSSAAAVSSRPKNPLLERIVNKSNSKAKNMRYQHCALAVQNQNINFEQHYAASSAMSDTSEAPSLASHVRGVKVPQNNGDLDQYLDDLFNPMLDEVELDELSDARSLATSIRGTVPHNDESLIEADNLGDLCNPEVLSKIIRGSDVQQADEKESDARGDTGTLSPTFESLLESLKENTDSVAATGSNPINDDDPNLGRETLMSQLSGMNLNELKALNQKLEDKIQVAQMNRASYYANKASGMSSSENVSLQPPPPPPPPQPEFGEPSVDDIYSRAKTIRIGKWRWPPAEGQTPSNPVEESNQKAQQAAIEKYFQLKEQKRLSQVSVISSSSSSSATKQVSEQAVEQQVCEGEVSTAASSKDSDERKTSDQQQSGSASVVALSNVGKLKISSEMKAKLEQLTTSSGTTQQQPQTGSHNQLSGIVSQVKKNLLSPETKAYSGITDEAGEGKRVKWLENYRKELLENQLLGANNSHPEHVKDNSNRASTESTGSKVLAAKQQLAAAAGVALAALGSDTVHSSQASSRRQSGLLVSDQQEPLGVKQQQKQIFASKSDERNSRAMQDELGPQSQVAISQRQVFYQISASSDQLDNLAELAKTAKSEHGGSEIQLCQSGDQITRLTQACAMSSDNLQQNNSALSGRAGKVAVNLPPASNLTRSIQIPSNLNEAGQSSELGKECDRIYGRSVAKSLSQRQHESLADKLKSSIEGANVLGGDSQWVSSSPDATLESSSRRQAAVARKRDNSAKRANADSGHNQQVSSKQRVLSPERQQSGKSKHRQFNYEHSHNNSKPSCCLSYANVDWQIKIRKEFFMPSETYDDPFVVQLIFAQLVADVFNPRHWTRLNSKERAAIKSLMKDNSIGYAPSLPQIGQMQSVKRDLVRMARSFGLYFTRSYPAQNYALIGADEDSATCQSSLLEGLRRRRENGHRGSSLTKGGSRASSSSSSASSSCCSSPQPTDEAAKTDEAIRLMKRLRKTNNLGLEWIDMVAVHHSGLRLVSIVSNSGNNNADNRAQVGKKAPSRTATAASSSIPSAGPPFGYRVLETLKYRDMSDVSQVGQFELLVSMRNEKKGWLLSSNQSSQLVSLLKCFLADYNDHLKSSQQAQERDSAISSGRNNTSLKPTQKKTTTASSRNDLSNNNDNKDALLASDDDHHGDHLTQRQTANGFSRLHKATNSNNDLVDNKRVLSNNLANNNTKIKQQQQQQYIEQHQQHSSSSIGGNNSERNVKSSSNSIKHLSPGTSRSNIASPTSPSESCDRAIIEPIEQRKSSSGISLESDQHRENQKPQDQQQQQQQQQVKQSSSKSSNKKNSLWQNSLSRMSNKFSIFSGSQSRASNANNSSDEKRPINLTAGDVSSVVEQNNNITTTGSSHSSRSAQVALDAWIETKVDFDEDDDEGRNSNSPVVSSSVAKEATNLRENASTGDQQQQSLLSQASIEYSSSSSVADKKQSSVESQQQQQQTSVDATDSGKAEADGKYSLLQFALYNFREAIDKYSLESCASKARVLGDTSTLRGSLKLIETLRNSKNSSGLNIASTSGGNGSSIIGKDSRKSSRFLSSANSNSNNTDWTWRELAEMVKFTKVPIKQSLLKFQNDDLNKRAVDCFLAIMQYMGDAPIPATSNHISSLSKHHNSNQSSSQDEVECVYLILMNCHNFSILRDEIYCQLMKQTTNNKSTNQDSCLMGWRLFSIVAAYFDCSEAFKPYLLKYLETAAYDKRRAFCSVASLCLQNLRKTFKYGGRKNVPSIEEIAATSAGRNSKRQIYRLPGGTERVINTKSTTVVEDIIHEICLNMLNVTDQDEMLEFSLYCIADGDLYTMPLNRDEYILDITTELIKNHQQYFLIFCRSIWHYPLRLDSKLYIEVIFNQIAPDYLEGLLLVLPNLKASYKNHQDHTTTTSTSRKQFRLKNKLVKEIARIAALLHRASGTDYMPHKDEVKYLLPKPIITAIKQYQRSLNSNNNQSLAIVNEFNQSNSSSAASSSGSQVGRNMSSLEQSVVDKQHSDNINDDNHYETSDGTIITTPQKWIELVQANWREMSAFDTLDAKAQFLDIVRHWPLFGSSFFAIKFIQRDLIQPLDFILALNKLGIQMLDRTTHETIHKYPFNEVISTRKVRSEDGALFLDLKCGNLMKRTIIRIQTDQAHEISRLIRQYIDIELLQQKQLSSNNNHRQLKPTTKINSTNLEPPDLTATSHDHFINHDQTSMVNRGSESELG